MTNAYDIQPETLAQCQQFDVQLYSDLHKDAYGYRPRVSLAHLSAVQLDIEWNRTCKDLEMEMEHERVREADALNNWENLVAETIASGARDYATAVRWLHQAQGLEGDDLDYLLWGYGITSFDNTSEIRRKAGLELTPA